ncbi:MAG: hypothetical protein WC679_02565 [Bacteroidales bacterium]
MITYRNIKNLQFSMIDFDGLFSTHTQNLILHCSEENIDILSLSKYIDEALHNKIIVNSRIDVKIRGDVSVISSNSLEFELPSKNVLVLDTVGNLFSSILNYIKNILYENSTIPKDSLSLEFSSILEHDIKSEYINAMYYTIFSDSNFIGGRSYIALEHDDLFRTTCLDCLKGVEAFNRITEVLKNSIFVNDEDIHGITESHYIIKVKFDDMNYLFQFRKNDYKVIILSKPVTLSNIIEWFYLLGTFEFSMGHVKRIHLSIGSQISVSKQYRY